MRYKLMATAAASRVSRDILEDRITGLLNNPALDEWSDTQKALSGVLVDLVSKVARIHGDDTHPIVDELRLIIWENVVRMVDESGLAQ